MSETKRYYWLKLPENFFDATDDETISFIEEQEGGSAYVLFYLKLLCKALRTDGTLIRLIGNRYVPYDEKSLSKLTNTPVDTVRCAVAILKEVGLLKQLDSGELYLTQINEFVGSETNKAVAMRKTRAKNRLEGNNVTPALPDCYPDVTQSKRKSIEKELENREEELEKELDNKRKRFTAPVIHTGNLAAGRKKTIPAMCMTGYAVICDIERNGSHNASSHFNFGLVCLLIDCEPDRAEYCHP